MKKVVPILLLSLAVLTFIFAVSGFISALIGAIAGERIFKALALPFCIVTAVVSVSSGGFSLLFKLDRLCRIAFIIYVASFCFALTGIILGFS